MLKFYLIAFRHLLYRIDTDLAYYTPVIYAVKVVV